MKQAKCTSCGANIEVDENSEVGTCPYCKAAYATDKAIKNFNNTTNNNANVINNYYGSASNANSNIKIPKTQRPKVSIPLTLLGLYCGFFPGIIYLIYIKKKQKEWDDKYTY